MVISLADAPKPNRRKVLFMSMASKIIDALWCHKGKCRSKWGMGMREADSLLILYWKLWYLYEVYSGEVIWYCVISRHGNDPSDLICKLGTDSGYTSVCWQQSYSVFSHDVMGHVMGDAPAILGDKQTWLIEYQVYNTSDIKCWSE